MEELHTLVDSVDASHIVRSIGETFGAPSILRLRCHERKQSIELQMPALATLDVISGIIPDLRPCRLSL